MAGAESGAVVTMEVFVEQHAISPVWIVLKLSRAAKDGPMAGWVLHKDIREAAANLLRDLIKVHLAAGTRWTFDRELVAIVGVILQQSTNHQSVDRHPDWPAPIRIAAEHARIGFGWQIRDAVLVASGLNHIRMVGMIARERSQPELA